MVGHFLARDGRDGFRIVPIPREEEGIGILSGLSLAGTRALMIIQDNGVGNLLTALNTFALPYHLPMLVLVTRRGGLGEYNSLYCPQSADFGRARTQMDRSRREGGGEVAATLSSRRRGTLWLKLMLGARRSSPGSRP